MKAILRNAALSISLKGAFAAGTSHIRMNGLSSFVKAHENHVMILRGFIDHFVVGKGVNHASVNPSAIHEIGKGSPHIIISFW